MDSRLYKNTFSAKPTILKEEEYASSAARMLIAMIVDKSIHTMYNLKVLASSIIIH